MKNSITSGSSQLKDIKAFAIRQKKIVTHYELNERECQLVEQVVEGFVPSRIFDIHTHLLRESDFTDANRPQFADRGMVLDAKALRKGLQAWLPNRELRALCFGIPARGLECEGVNSWVGEQVTTQPGWKALALARPQDDPDVIAAQLAAGTFSGIKVYHLFAERSDSFNSDVEEFAPEWMWEVLHAHRGILMLHIVKDTAMGDPNNQKAIRRLCRKYPNCQLVLAHVARSFSHRHALKGLRYLRDLDNVWVDTSAVCENQSFVEAIEILGPERILFGSDIPVSNFRARSSTLGESFHWLYEDTEDPEKEALNQQMSLLGLESLRALREAAESCGLTARDLENVFHDNALRILGEPTETQEVTWADAQKHISCGTGLMSKRQEQFDPQSWPTFFSRCHGDEIWDQSGRRYVDFAGGVGAVLLGYGDREIERSLRRRLSAGTYCTLVNPEEDQLACLLLQWHPWASKVRFARGGGEAMTTAVRIARAATGRSGVAFCGYHGWQDWYLAANLGDDSALDGHLLPGLQPQGVPRELKGTAVPFLYNDLESLRVAVSKLGGRPAAIVMEPMRSQFPNEDFIMQVKSIAAETGAVFILDEVSSGWRYGFPGAHVRLGFEPDIAVYAKAMSNGFPCAAIVGREGIMDAANSSFISSSYWTDGIGTAAALACLRKIEREDISTSIWERGVDFQKQLRKLETAHSVCKLKVGGMPPSPSLTFELEGDSSAAKVLMIRGLASRGFLGSSQLYLMHAHTDEHITAFMGALDEVLSDLERKVNQGDLSATEGVPISTGNFARLT